MFARAKSAAARKVNEHVSATNSQSKHHNTPTLTTHTKQYKTVLDALRARRSRFVFADAEVALVPSVRAVITLNPGYPGRAELPESLTALFRPVSMVRARARARDDDDDWRRVWL